MPKFGQDNTKEAKPYPPNGGYRLYSQKHRELTDQTTLHLIKSYYTTNHFNTVISYNLTNLVY